MFLLRRKGTNNESNRVRHILISQASLLILTATSLSIFLLGIIIAYSVIACDYNSILPPQTPILKKEITSFGLRKPTLIFFNETKGITTDNVKKQDQSDSRHNYEENDLKLRLVSASKNQFTAHMPIEQGMPVKDVSFQKSITYHSDSYDKIFPYFGNSILDPIAYEPKGGKRYSEYKDGGSPFNITKSDKEYSDKLARERREHVRNGMKHAWNGYKTYAFGFDELLPVSGEKQNNWGGLGTTLIDSLDTLWLMDMKHEFWEARDWVNDELSFDAPDSEVSVFETTIRNLGGLLSAYDLSGDICFLDKAKDLGNRLIKAFSTPSGIPYGSVNLRSNSKPRDVRVAGGRAIISEIGTLQIELRYLSKATGDKSFAIKAEKVIEILKYLQPKNGLFPIFITNMSFTPHFLGKKITFGGLGDSLYEYFLKVWLQGGRTESMYRIMYDKSIEGMHDELLKQSPQSGLWYIATYDNGRMDRNMEHLVCFMGGLLALGAYTDPLGLDSERAQRDLNTARKLTYTCYQMYAHFDTGISPETVRFNYDIVAKDAQYMLRPEAVESFFVLSFLTSDPIYREWGWEVFQSIEKFCKTDIAYGALKDVRRKDLKPENRMESFFLAETMKYFFLLFDPDTNIDILQQSILNTEGHPTTVFK